MLRCVIDFSFIDQAQHFFECLRVPNSFAKWVVVMMCALSAVFMSVVFVFVITDSQSCASKVDAFTELNESLPINDDNIHLTLIFGDTEVIHILPNGWHQIGDSIQIPEVYQSTFRGFTTEEGGFVGWVMDSDILLSFNQRLYAVFNDVLNEGGTED